MDKNKKKSITKNNALIDLARHLRESAASLDDVAHRMRQAAENQRKNTARMRQINEILRASLNCSRKRSFTYLEYLEFSSADEFKRFGTGNSITKEEIARVNWEELSSQLLAS